MSGAERLKVHVLDELYHHSSNVAVLAAANMALSDVVRLTVFLTDQADLGTFVAVRDRVMGDHKPGAIILVVKALARPRLRIEIEAIAARVD